MTLEEFVKTTPIGQVSQVYVCLACGKVSIDKEGSLPISRGWDESCFLNSQLVETNRLIVKNNRVVEILTVEDTK